MSNFATVTTGSDNSIVALEMKQIGPQIFKWLFVIECQSDEGDSFPEMFVADLTQEKQSEYLEAIRSKGYHVSVYNVSAIQDEMPMHSLEDFMRDMESEQ